MSKYGKVYHINLLLPQDELPSQISAAFGEAVRDVLYAATNKGERIKYDTLKVETENDIPSQRLIVCATVETVPRPYTRDEMNDIQVDMARALMGVKRNG